MAYKWNFNTTLVTLSLPWRRISICTMVVRHEDYMIDIGAVIFETAAMYNNYLI